MASVLSEKVSPDHLRNLRDHVRDMLRTAILSGELETGQRLNERMLAVELGISTTPIKEALRGLEVEGLVVAQPRRGVFVTYGREQAEEMSLARAAIESMIARQATRNASEDDLAALAAIVARMRQATADADSDALGQLNSEFHAAIRAASRCRYLTQLQVSQIIYDTVSRANLLRDPGERHRALTEHEGIFNAIHDRDADRAERAMRDHVVRSGEQFISDMFGGSRQGDQE